MKTLKPRKIERILVLLVFLAMFSSMVINTRLGLQKHQTTLQKVREGWYRYVDGQKYQVTPPCRITVPKGQNLTIYYDGLTQEEGSRTIFTKGAVYRLRMEIGDKVIYEYEDTEFKRNRQMRSKLDCMAILPENPEGQTLSLTYENDGSSKFSLKPIYLGRSGEALRKLWYDNLVLILGVFTMSIIGVVCFCAHIYLRYLKIDDNRMGCAALFLMLCSAWCLLDCSIAQQVPSAASQMSVLSIYAFMAMPIPVIHFVRSTGELKKHKSLDYLLLMTYSNILLQAVLHMILRVHYSDMVPVTQLLHSISCSYMHYMLYKEYQVRPDLEITAVLQGIAILGAAGVVELILYWVLKSSWYGIALQLGTVLFIIRMLFAILSSLTANIQFKAEALAYKTMSREDRLTTLCNRRAFDEALSELESHAHRYHDVALFFMDVNGLKNVNDRHGHHAGDELIINAARAISAAFSEYGSCYRLGGDEFAAIITNPDFTPEQWAEKIDTAVEKQCAACRWPLSVAWGVSYQRDRNRNVKRSTDWLYEADQSMYQMKLRMKATREDLSEAHT